MTSLSSRTRPARGGSAASGHRRTVALAVVVAGVVACLVGVLVWARSRPEVSSNGPLGDSSLAGSEIVGDPLAPGHALTFSVGNAAGFRHSVTIQNAHLTGAHGVVVQAMYVVYEGHQGVGNVAYPFSTQQRRDYQRHGVRWSARQPLVGATLAPAAAGMTYEFVLILRMTSVRPARFDALSIRYRSAGRDYRLITAIGGRLTAPPTP